MPTIHIPKGTREAGPTGEFLNLDVAPGKIIAVLGANGAGKSAFLHDVYKLVTVNRDDRRIAEWIPAHRSITLSTDDYMITATSASQILEGSAVVQERFEDARFRPKRGESFLKAILQRIVDLDNERNRSYRDKTREDYASAKSIDEETGSFVDDINSVFARGALSISFDITKGELKPSKGGEQYKIPSLSDGERAALLLTAVVLSAEDGQILFIDEPEKHLNPAISQPLMRSLISSAKDIGLVFASHDVDLIESVRPTEIVVLKDSVPLKWYDIELVPFDEIENIDHAKATIYGGRKRTLLVEGSKGSLDAALYSIVYEGWNIQPVGSYADVIEGVRSLRQNARWHWIEAAGLIDRDGRDGAEVAALQADRVFPIAGASIESLLLDSRVLTAVATLKYKLEGGDNAAARVALANEVSVKEIKAKSDDLAAHVANWRFNRALLANKPSVGSIRDGVAPIVTLNPADFLATSKAEIEALLASEASLDLIGTKLPLKSSGAKAAAARALGFTNFEGYVRVVLHNMSKRTETGNEILEALRTRLPAL